MFDDVTIHNETRRWWNGDLQGIAEYPEINLSAV
jgi:hypothetical protein